MVVSVLWIIMKSYLSWEHEIKEKNIFKILLLRSNGINWKQKKKRIYTIIKCIFCEVIEWKKMQMIWVNLQKKILLKIKNYIFVFIKINKENKVKNISVNNKNIAINATLLNLVYDWHIFAYVELFTVCNIACVYIFLLNIKSNIGIILNKSAI